MNGMRSLLVCVLIVLLGNVLLVAQVQSPEGGASPAKPTPKAQQIPSEKPAVAEVSQQAKTESAPVDFCLCVGKGDSPASIKIERALNAPIHSPGLNYADRALRDVVAHLQDEYAIPIQIDGPALDEAGIGTDAPVTISLHDISLRSALKLILRRLQLTWIIQDEVLLITTKECAEKDLDTCVYNVQGLVDDSDPKSVKALIDVICSCVATDTWAENGGGQAEVRPLPSGLLVVSQTAAIQEEVFTLLDKVRKMRKSVPLSKVGPHGYEPPPRQSSSGKSEKGGGPGGGGFGTGKRGGD
jgi:hypothetical protein